MQLHTFAESYDFSHDQCPSWATAWIYLNVYHLLHIKVYTYPLLELTKQSLLRELDFHRN